MKRVLIMFLSIIILSNIFATNVFSLQVDKIKDFSVVSISQDEKAVLLSKYSTRSVPNDSYEYAKRFIYSFDVSDDGTCAIFLDNAMVIIIDSYGNLIDKFSFDKNLLKNKRVPSSVLIQWNNNDLEVFFGSDLMCICSADGELKDVLKIENAFNGGGPPRRTKKTINQVEYKLSNCNQILNFVSDRYKYLISSDISNTEKIVFKSENRLISNIDLMFIAIVVVVICAVLILVILNRKRTHVTVRNH